MSVPRWLMALMSASLLLSKSICHAAITLSSDCEEWILFATQCLLLKTALCFPTCRLTIYEIAETPYHAMPYPPLPRPHYEIPCHAKQNTDQSALHYNTKVQSCRSMRLVRHEAIPLAPMANTHHIATIIIIDITILANTGTTSLKVNSSSN